MKLKVFFVIVFSMLIGSFIDAGTTAINKSYDSKLWDEMFGKTISPEEFKTNPYAALERFMKDPNTINEAKVYSKKSHLFAWCMFVIKIFLWLVLSYWLSLVVVKITHNNSLKAQPAAAGTSPTGAALQHSAGGSAP